MEIRSQLQDRIEIIWQNNVLSTQGSYKLILLIDSYFENYGSDISLWTTVNAEDSSGIQILLNEFILKYKKVYSVGYEHAEICHCRTVPTEMVVQSIKAGCRSLRQIGHATKAGTGCGTCRESLSLVLNQVIGRLSIR